MGVVTNGSKSSFFAPSSPQEFLELGVTSYPGDGASFWQGLLREHQLLALLTTLLADDHHPVCRTAIDICLLLCDPEGVAGRFESEMLPAFHPAFLSG